MKPLYLQEILTNIDGNLIKGTGNPLIKNVLTNEKKIRNNTLFFHWNKKKSLDLNAFQKYKDTVIVTVTPGIFTNIKTPIIIIKVADIDAAYWKFVNYYRNLFHIRVIGVTGTCGKTTVKEMIKHILSAQYHVHATHKSDNALFLNLRYLLGIDDATQAAVFEMGVAWPGDLANSCKHFQPDIRIILNIGVYHLVGCKTPEAYMKAKTEMLEGLDPINGTLILNADDENIKKIDVSKFQNLIYFGTSKKAKFRAEEIRYGEGGMKFTLHYKKAKYRVFVPGFGEHNVYNALAAIAATSWVGMDLKQIIENLASFKQVEEHLEIHSGKDGCTIIDDSWNNSPPSMSAALQVLEDISPGKKTIALLGYMPQLGEKKYAQEQYAQIGQKVIETKTDLLVVVGEEAAEIGRKALELGMDQDKVYFSVDGKEIFEFIRSWINKNTVILLKIPHRLMVQSSFKEFKNNLLI